MINPMYIQEKMISRGISAEYVYCKKTSMLDLHKFSIKLPNSENEVLTIWSSKHVGKKLFMQIDSGIDKIADKDISFIEEIVKEAIIHTPNNKMPHLFDPIQFVSQNVINEQNFDLCEERIQEQFDSSTTTLMSKMTNEAMSYYGFTIPSNNKENLVASLFKKLPTVFSVEKVKENNIIKFYKHGDSLKDEFNKLRTVKDKLKDIGIVVEISSIYGVLMFSTIKITAKIIDFLHRGGISENMTLSSIDTRNIVKINEVISIFI